MTYNAEQQRRRRQRQRAELLAATVSSPSRRVRWCWPCLTESHDRCVGIGCVCRVTERCCANADLTEEREKVA